MDLLDQFGAYGRELFYALFNLLSISLMVSLIASTRDPSRGVRWWLNLLVRWGLAELALLMVVFTGVAVKEFVADLLRIVFPYWVSLRGDALTSATIISGMLAIGKMGSALLLNAVFESAAPTRARPGARVGARARRGEEARND